MQSLTNIENKLALFYKKYYKNDLIKGCIFFFSLGILYLIITVYVESVLWLKPINRFVLFWLFIVIELLLFSKFILIPIIKLFKLKEGINNLDSSKIIGNYFPEIKDKLLNLLQLKQADKTSDLLIASIEQKSDELNPFRFSESISFQASLKYLKYILLPAAFFSLSLINGLNLDFTQSFNRVVNYQSEFSPPAPFTLSLQTSSLDVVEGQSHKVLITSKGKTVPNEVKIVYNNQTYFTKNEGKGAFSFIFLNVINPIDFYFESGDVSSPFYSINVIKTPLIKKVKIKLDYPYHTKKQDEIIENTGNLSLPEGTKVEWNIDSKQTESVSFIEGERRLFFSKLTEDNFNFRKTIISSLEYKISSSNTNLKDFETLSYKIKVVKDEYPTITIQTNIDSLYSGEALFAGKVSDDYGLKNLKVVFYDQSNIDKVNIVPIKLSKENTQTFFYQFPGSTSIEDGVDYEIYFQVSDNDIINGSKSVISKKYTFRKKTNDEVLQEQIKEQKESINTLENIFKNNSLDQEKLLKIQNELKNKKDLSWRDKNKINKVIDRQNKYNEMIERQAEKLYKALDKNKFNQSKSDNLKQRIKELLKNDKQKRILTELQKLSEKINKEELIKKAEKLAKNNKQQQRSLESLLELTKRFYVEEKTIQIANKLEELSKKQQNLFKAQDVDLEKQKTIGKEFKDVSKELDQLAKDNQGLKNPMSLPDLEELEKEVKESLVKSEKKLYQKENVLAKKEQEKSSKKMQEMSKKMQNSISEMQSNSIDENIEDLRKILENLLIFSFKQEESLLRFKELSSGHPDFGKELAKQNQLKTYFEHVDDSLFVLSMRLPELTSKIQTELTNTHYNLDRSLENFAENRFDSGSANQQYVITSTNILSDFLSNLLSNLQNSKNSLGKKGKKNSFSLPTLIEKQKGISEKLKNGLQKSKKKGQDGNEGEKGKKGSSGSKSTSEFNKGGQSGDIFEIFKQQSYLRETLTKIMAKEGDSNGTFKKAIKSMEQLENEIINNGFTQSTLKRMQQLEYQLLKLNTALVQQGKQKNKKATPNTSNYKNNNLKQLQFKKQFYNQIEILNRQSLPLQQNFEKKVQKYFSKKNKE
ncbi:hypothetical protein OAV73_00520 [Flavobacteriaceae bacterium]|nr:hypothetical protein [Flavobacteriaceae bacterium]